MIRDDVPFEKIDKILEERKDKILREINILINGREILQMYGFKFNEYNKRILNLNERIIELNGFVNNCIGNWKLDISKSIKEVVEIAFEYMEIIEEREKDDKGAVVI